MSAPITREEIIERSSALVKEVMDLEGHWRNTTLISVEHPLRQRTEEQLAKVNELADQIAAVFIASPVTSLSDAEFAWAVYEAANARLNLTYLLLFGVNSVYARHEGLVPKVAGQDRKQ